MKPAPLAAALALWAIAASAHDYRLGEVVIDHPTVVAATPRVGAGYMTIVNHGAAPVTLLSVETEAAARVEIHATEVDAAGVARMIHQRDGVAIAPGGSVAFAPGGLHVMLMGLAKPIAAGDRVAARLVFDAGVAAVEFWGEERGDASPAHEHHSHGG